MNMAATGFLVAEHQISTCTSPNLTDEMFVFGSINLFFQVSPSWKALSSNSRCFIQDTLCCTDKDKLAKYQLFALSRLL